MKPAADVFNELFVANQRQIRRIAMSMKRKHPGTALSVTTLYQEAYLKLVRETPDEGPPVDIQIRAATAMRHFIVDDARRRAAVKRGGDGSVRFVEWDENVMPVEANDRWIGALDDALKQLAVIDADQAQMVELHFFCGLQWTEVAGHMGLSVATVERRWRAARAFLAKQMN